MPQWIGRAFLSQSRMLYSGMTGPTAGHSHHAFQLMLALEGELRLRDYTGNCVTARAFLVPPDTSHEIVAANANAIVLWIDPDDAKGRRLRNSSVFSARTEEWARSGAGLAGLIDLPPLTGEDADRITGRILATLGVEDVRPTPLHPAVSLTLRLVAQSLEGRPRLGEFASDAGLSASRLAHLFREQVGTPFRPYVLWCRLRRSAEAIQGGANLTTAAHVAGFSDSAHMSRSFRRMFGLAPSDAMGAIEWVALPNRRIRTSGPEGDGS